MSKPRLKKGSQEWYQEMMRKFAVKKGWILANRMNYLEQLLLNYQQTYDVDDNPKCRKWYLAWSEYVKKSCIYGMQKGENGNLGGVYWDTVKMEAQHRIVDSYFLYLERKREEKARFYEPRRVILMKLGVVQALQELIDDKLDILSISMPPGVGKTTLEIFLLSGIMGWYPELPNLVSSFSGTMTKSIYDGVNQIISDPEEYAWHDLFPDIQFNARTDTNSKDQTINVGKPKRFKTLTCRAINASLTGTTRCEYLLCADDLCSGIEEALSIDRLNKLWMSFNTDLMTRRKNKCKLLMIATRWSVHDPIGRLQLANKDNPRARFIATPALDENGESNFEFRRGVGFTTAYFNEIKSSMDDISFRCLFMNEPIEREGLLYHEDEIRRYLTLPVEEPDAVLSVVDTKNKGTDYFFQPVFLKYGDDYYPSCYAGIFHATGFLDGLQKIFMSAGKKFSPFASVLTASILASMVACNQTLAIMLTHQLCAKVEPRPEIFALQLENSAVLVSPLIPWSIACAVILTVIGAPLSGVLAAFYLWLVPACYLRSSS